MMNVEVPGSEAMDLAVRREIVDDLTELFQILPDDVRRALKRARPRRT